MANPATIHGSDANGVIRPVLVTSDGHLLVSFTFPTANQQQNQPVENGVVTIADFVAPQTVSGTTALLPFTNLAAYQSLLFTGACISGGPITFTLDTSQDAQCKDVDRQMVSSPVNANQQTSWEVGPSQLRKFFMLSSTGTGSVKWQVLGFPR